MGLQRDRLWVKIARINSLVNKLHGRVTEHALHINSATFSERRICVAHVIDICQYKCVGGIIENRAVSKSGDFVSTRPRNPKIIGKSEPIDKHRTKGRAIDLYYWAGRREV